MLRASGTAAGGAADKGGTADRDGQSATTESAKSPSIDGRPDDIEDLLGPSGETATIVRAIDWHSKIWSQYQHRKDAATAACLPR